MVNFGCSYYDNKNPIHFRTDMEYLKQNGLNHLVLCFSENDQKYYADNFKKLVAICKEYEIETWLDPWAYGGIYGGEAFSWFASWIENCKQVAINSNNEHKKVSVLCFNNPETKQLMKNWVDAACATNCDGIFWDEPHFFEPSHFGYTNDYKGCFCEHCQKLYKNLYNKELSYNSVNLAEFKAKSIQLFLAEMMEYTKQKGKKNIICLLPDYHNLDLYFDDIEAYFKNPLADVIGTDPYPALFGKNHEDAAKITDKMLEFKQKYNKKINYWVQGFRLKQEFFESWLKEIEYAKKAELDYISIWSFRACESMTHLNCFDSKKVWYSYLEKIK